MRALQSSLLVLVVALNIATVAAEPQPSKIVITPASADAAIILQTQSTPLDYYLSIQGFEQIGPSGGIMREPGLGFRIKKKHAGKFMARKVRPGRYVIHMITQQAYWADCFNGSTYQFTIGRGQILTLGEFDASKAIANLQGNVVRSGRDSIRGAGLIHFLDDVPPPAFNKSFENVALAKTWARSAMPRTTVEVEAASLIPATFVAKATFGGARVCGTGKNETKIGID